MVSPIDSKRSVALPLVLLCFILLGLGTSSCDSPLDSIDEPLNIDTIDWVGPGEKPRDEDPTPDYAYLLSPIEAFWSVPIHGQFGGALPEFWSLDVLSYSLAVSEESTNEPNQTLMDISFELERTELSEYPFYFFPELGPIPVATHVEIDLKDIKMLSFTPGISLPLDVPIENAATVDFGIVREETLGKISPEGSLSCEAFISLSPDQHVPQIHNLEIQLFGILEHAELGPIEYQAMFVLQRFEVVE